MEAPHDAYKQKSCCIQYCESWAKHHFAQRVLLVNIKHEHSQKTNCKMITDENRKLVGIDCSLLSSPSNTYTHCFSLIWAKIWSKISVSKMKKIDNFVSNCSGYMVQPFVLEVLMSSFERYPSWKITIPRRYLPPGGGREAPYYNRNFILIEYFYFKVIF